MDDSDDESFGELPSQSAGSDLDRESEMDGFANPGHLARHRADGDDDGGQNLVFGGGSTCHIRNMPDYSDEISGAHIDQHTVRPPTFRQEMGNASGWVPFAVARDDWESDDAFGPAPGPPVPKRMMCWNIPAECFSNDAYRFAHWHTPLQNSQRAAHIAMLVSLMYAGLSKGYPSGNHEEHVRGDQEGEEDEQGGKRKRPSVVSQYMFVDPTDSSRSAPMLVHGMEYVMDRQGLHCVAVRLWMEVFDPLHSTSKLVRDVIKENETQHRHAGHAHMPSHVRKKTLVAEQKTTRALAGGAHSANASLEKNAGTQYTRVISVTVYTNLLDAYAGKSDNSPGRPAIDSSKIPRGVWNASSWHCKEGFGGTSPASPEWLFNAKRPEALAAGLVHLDGTLMDVDPRQLDPKEYYDRDTGERRVPFEEHFFYQTNPTLRSVFDMPLPRTIAGSIQPGPTLLRLYRDQHEDPAMSLASHVLLDRFNNHLTGTDQWTKKQIQDFAETITTWDSAECDDDKRLLIGAAKSAIATGNLRSYGAVSSENEHLIETQHILKDIAFETPRMHQKVIAGWASERTKAMDEEEAKIRASDPMLANSDISDPAFAGLMAKKAEFVDTHTSAMKELFELHVARIDRAFNSKADLQTIPPGYRAAYQGLFAELAHMPNKSANVAHCCNMQLTDSKRSVFGHISNWLTQFLSEDLFIDGRDVHVMEHLLYHCFEQYNEVTLLLILYGPKGARRPPRPPSSPLPPVAAHGALPAGNGKTLRTERLMAAFVKNCELRTTS